MGVGHWGQVSLPWVFRLAALLTDIYCTIHHSQQASTSEEGWKKLTGKQNSQRRVVRLDVLLLKFTSHRE